MRAHLEVKAFQGHGVNGHIDISTIRLRRGPEG